jgi:DNA-binding response OmpR family regulator
MAGTVLIVEDNAGYRKSVVNRLRGMDLQVIEASNAQQAGQCLNKRIIDLVILDIALGKVAAMRGEPGGDSGSSGFELLELIRSREEYISVIVLTGLEEPVYQAACLDRGADDFLLKGGNADVFAARVRCSLRRTRLLRRYAQAPKAGMHHADRFGTLRLEAGVFRLDVDRMLQVKDSELIRLSDLEAELLLLMARQPGQVFRSEELGEHLWGSERGDLGADSVVKTLRTKIARLGGKGLMERVWRIGHRLNITFPAPE